MNESQNYATARVKQFLCALTLMLLLPAAAWSKDEVKIDVSGSVTPGVQQVKLTPNSSKFNEYRDIRDGFYLYDLELEAPNTELGRFLDLRWRNIQRKDQNLMTGIGSYGRWGLEFEWDEIPHLLSNKAMSPYWETSPGMLEVPLNVSDIAAFDVDSDGDLDTLTENLAPSTSALAINTLLAESWLDRFLHPVELGNDRRKGAVSFGYLPSKNLKLRLDYSNENRDGSKIGYGPIGDRPPRTLAIQLAEPIDYQTKEIKLESDYARDDYQIDFSYARSDFENNKGVLTWENIYATPTATCGSTGATCDTWSTRNVATYGRRALPQDSDSNNLSFAFGVDLTGIGRLTGAAVYNTIEQDESLIPYSTNDTLDAAANGGDGLAWNSTAKLPRASADAEIKTKLLNLDYTVNSIERLNLNAFFRWYDLQNDTPTSQWRYMTQDTTGNTTGSVAYLNMRRNLAYEYDKKNFGFSGAYNFAGNAAAMSLGFEREEIDRQFREADTEENIFRASLRSRPASRLDFHINYTVGDRKTDHYEGEAARDSYWYPAASATAGTADSQFTFENHPDTRRFDVTDRDRNQLDIQVGITPTDTLNVSADYRYLNNDYDSGVSPSQPLLNYAGGITLANSAATSTTPGNQLGLLEDKRRFYGLDLNYNPSERSRLSFYANREKIDTLQRGFEFDENNKADPNSPTRPCPPANATTLVGWNCTSGQWVADVSDKTNTFGLGFGYELTPGKLDLNTDYIYSSGKIDIDYSGWGSSNADNTPFAFRTPETVRNKRNTFSTNMEYKAADNVSVGFGYTYERYTITDWQQESATPQQASVNGNENLLQDTSGTTSSGSNQWGNRLPNLGSYLAPSYKAHILRLAVMYKF